MKTNDNTYEWERGCSATATCVEKNGGADDWMTCCNTENCNVQKEYPTDPKKRESGVLFSCILCVQFALPGFYKM